MSAVQTHPLVDDYLRRLHAAAWLLPPDRREELVAEIREHADDALAASGSRDEVTVRNVLERLGPPEEIVAAAVEGQAGVDYPQPGAASSGGRAGHRAGAIATQRVGGVEVVAIVALAIGGIVVPVVGVVVGIVLAWASTLWTRLDKLVASALPAAFVALGVVAVAARLLPFGGRLPMGHRFGEMLPFAVPSFPVAVGSLGLVTAGVVVGGMMAAVYLAVQAARRTRPT